MSENITFKPFWNKFQAGSDSKQLFLTKYRPKVRLGANGNNTGHKKRSGARDRQEIFEVWQNEWAR
jgi:hypothetical protein